jgi:short-subunit dehydrogenase
MSSTKYTLITGSTSGIGLALAKEFALRGKNLLLVSRDLEKLKKTQADLTKDYPEIKIQIIASDLSQITSPFEVFEKTQREKWQVDTLINNAGFANNGFFADLETQKELAQINLNITALSLLTKLFLPQMLADNYGKILNVASTAAFQPGPFMATYYASKAFVYSFSTALSKELENTKVNVCVLCPGATKTNFFKAAKMESAFFNKNPMIMSAKAVAKIAVDGLLEGKRVIIPGFGNWFFAFLVRFVPLNVILSLVANLDK